MRNKTERAKNPLPVIQSSRRKLRQVGRIDDTLCANKVFLYRADIDEAVQLYIIKARNRKVLVSEIGRSEGDNGTDATYQGAASSLVVGPG
jgi:hypothetical protein